tara:strand:- start:8141 stop:8935 length:795 start_codon:yes stop_codon:yes gene_type:complete
MKGQKYKKKVTVIIVNFNNKKYVNRCIKSITNQTYSNIEIIFVDDKSTDNSLSIAKKYKKVKVFSTNKKTKFGSFNQINSYKTGLLKSSGEIIFFLDSDDFYERKKVETVVSYFNKENLQICFDKPILFFNGKKKIKLNINNRSKYFIPWPKFSPQSCIAIKKKYLKKIWNKINIKKFPDIWLDFRIINQAFIDKKNIFVIPNHLTFYQQQKGSISYNFRKFSLNWWTRRLEAHKFLDFLYKKNNLKNFISFDRLFTKLINRFI